MFSLYANEDEIEIEILCGGKGECSKLLVRFKQLQLSDLFLHSAFSKQFCPFNDKVRISKNSIKH